MNSRSKITKGTGWLAKGLGWFSIIIGLFGMISPHLVARWFGVRNRPLIFKLLGLREIASGLGVLFGRNKGSCLWARAGCDARRIGATICGSDLHIYDGYIPTMEKGDILGHEFMGEVVELGSEVHNLQKGDRVVVPFPIACGQCYFCQRGLFSFCDNSNPNAALAERMWGHSPAGIYGYSHLLGGFAGGQAEYARFPSPTSAR